MQSNAPVTQMKPCLWVSKPQTCVFPGRCWCPLETTTLSEILQLWSFLRLTLQKGRENTWLCNYLQLRVTEALFAYCNEDYISIYPDRIRLPAARWIFGVRSVNTEIVWCLGCSCEGGNKMPQDILSQTMSLSLLSLLPERYKFGKYLFFLTEWCSNQYFRRLLSRENCDNNRPNRCNF